MIFTDHQIMMFKSRALFLLGKLREWDKHDNETKASFIVADFQEMFSQGYGFARGEVCSTPWERMCQPITNDANEMEAVMDDVSLNGWEFYTADSGWMIWRRWRAVADIVAAKKETE